MFGLCDSASSALMICIIVSIVLIAAAAILGYGINGEVSAAIGLGLAVSILCFLVSAFIVMSKQDDEIDKSLKDSLSRNYPGYVSLKTDYYGDADYSFACDGQKYTCDFDYENNKTLTVYCDDSKTVDGVYIDGKKQDEDNSKSKSADKKQSCSQASEIITEDNSSGSDSLLDHTASYNNGGLVGNIQNKILEKYSGAIITGFDMIKYAGSFTYNNTQYSFSWKDGLLEVENTTDVNDVTYYKVAE